MTGFQHPEGYTHHYSKAGVEVISRLAYEANALGARSAIAQALCLGPLPSRTQCHWQLQI